MELAKVRETFEFILGSWRKAQALRAKAQAYRLSATGGGIRYDKDHVQTSPEDYQSIWIIKAVDCDSQAAKIIEMSDGVRLKAVEWMEAVCRENEQFVLNQHYLLGRTYTEISDEYVDLFDYGSKTTMFDIAQRGMRRIAEKF